MRALALTGLATALAALTFAMPARVKADANAAVCAQSYGPNEGLRCDFYNFQQCEAYVKGLAGSCIGNPYFRSSSNQAGVSSRSRR